MYKEDIRRAAEREKLNNYVEEKSLWVAEPRMNLAQFENLKFYLFIIICLLFVAISIIKIIDWKKKENLRELNEARVILMDRIPLHEGERVIDDIRTYYSSFSGQSYTWTEYYKKQNIVIFYYELIAKVIAVEGQTILANVKITKSNIIEDNR